jgi:hypothetical protein
VRVTIENLDHLDEWVWRTNVLPSELRLLGRPNTTLGEVTVVYLSQADFSEAEKSVSFELANAHVLNVGSSDRTLIIAQGDQHEVTRGRSDTVPSSHSDGLALLPARDHSGDDDFRSQLPKEIHALGEGLLNEVRRRFGGRLLFYPLSGKYVESPDNFWTIKVQPRDKSLRITVRGRPEQFNVPDSIELKADMTGYSSFKVRTLDQLGAALSLITQARKKGTGRRRSRTS